MSDLGTRLAGSLREIMDFPKPGINFRDISPMLMDPVLLRDVCHELAAHAKSCGAEVIAGIDSRGFLFATPMALELSVGTLMIRKPNKLPGEKVTVTYEKEYGTDGLQVQAGACTGKKVYIVDDLLATGGSCQAACRLVELAGGEVAGCGFVIALEDLKGADTLRKDDTRKDLQIRSLVGF